MNTKSKLTSSNQALVVLSGGQDSTTCLFWAIREFKGKENIETITFDYGQRHKIEIDSAKKIAEIAGVPNKILHIPTLAELGGNALSNSDIPVQTDAPQNGQLPNTFVPGRNIIFLTFAAAYAYQLSIHHIVTGVAQTDYSGYPDCRDNTVKALQVAISLGMDYNLTIHTPLMWKTKADTVRLAEECGAMDALAWSHTCYNGKFPPCGACPACKLRAKGFEEAGLQDPIYRRVK